MPPILRASILLTVVLLPFVAAQEGPPGPAPELQKLGPMLGNWAGTGTAQMGAEAAKWRAHASYRWCLDGHFLQEDFQIAFEGRPAPMVFRAYLGWDRENGRYVNATVNNAGAARLHEFHLLDDGTMLQAMQHHQGSLPYAERARTRVSGEAMQLTIDLLMAEGPSLQVIDGTLTRTDEVFTLDWQTKGFEHAIPAPELQMLARSAGDYEVQGSMVIVPGQPPLQITGTDSFRPVFGDTIFYGTTKGAAEGVPGEYRGDVFWGFDAPRKCLTAVYVSNMGEVMTIDGRWSGDGRLVSTFAGVMGGQPMVQRMLMSFDDQGRAVDAVAHTIVGTGDPFESFRATYTAK